MVSQVLDGKVAVVVGGGRGVGRAHARALAAAGAKVLVNDLGCDLRGEGHDPAVAEAVAAELREAGADAIADDTDVATGAAQIVSRALEAWGRVDAVVGAAGLALDRTVMKMDDAGLDRMIDVHVKGSFALVRHAARAMIDAGDGGSIVLHTGPAAFFGAARQSALGATSAAIAGLVRSAAIELRKHAIRVNAIAPTARTRSTEKLPLFTGIAPDSMGPEFVAPVAVFLASDHAREVSGEVLGVAGTRYYALHGRETPGWFAEGAPPTPEALAQAWSEVTRG